MRWAGHVVHIEKRRGAYLILMENMIEGAHLEDPSLMGE